MMFRNEVVKILHEFKHDIQPGLFKKKKFLRGASNLIQFYFGDKIESTLDIKVTRSRLFLLKCYF